MKVARIGVLIPIILMLMFWTVLIYRQRAVHEYGMTKIGLPTGNNSGNEPWGLRDLVIA